MKTKPTAKKENFVIFQPLVRPIFFPGKLLTADDLNAEQEYFIGRHRRHNRALHGFGVVQGLRVSSSGAGHIQISAGLALDCLGQEVILEQTKEIKILKSVEKVLYLGICFVEEQIDITPTLPTSVQDFAESFNAARLKESFRFDWYSEDPCAHQKRKTAFPETCGRAHPITLARLILRKGKRALDSKYRRVYAKR